MRKNRQQFNGMACLWMVVAVIAGVCLALSVSTWVFKKAPNDLLRTNVLLEALEDEELNPQFVVMGSSVVMSGVDTRRITSKLPGKPLGLNLATTGQNPADSYLYYQNLPKSVGLILQFTTPRFAIGKNAIELQKYNAMYMYGYRPNDNTESTLINIFGERVENIFSMSNLEQRFQSRWVVRQAADNIVRNLVRDDLNFNSYTFDLYFPNNGANRLSALEMQRSLSRRYIAEHRHDYPATEEKALFFKNAGNQASKLGKKFALIINPIHPEVHRIYGDDWYRLVRKYFNLIEESSDFYVIDASDAIGEEYFVDALHISKSGAEVLSDFLVKEIMRLNLNPTN
ncbi:MAG: hypothetical protein VYA80_06820 [Pseudomonadota bacterium]|nr:hypothetical protein [Pseudomonadota bacterium]